MVSEFKDFYKKFPYLDIKDLIIYYAIFDGYPLQNQINLSRDFNTVIQKEILDKIESLKEYFIYDHMQENQELIEKILTRLSKGDRKNHNVYIKENIPQIKGRELFKHLFEIGEIQKEVSREKPLRNSKNQPLKKYLRRYKIQDKIHLKNNFTRFWFTFISPELKKYNKITLKSINQYLEKFISLEFEKLSNQLVAKDYKEIISSGSYWDKNVEIDLYIQTSNLKIAGEAKWKNSKICKNVLNSLQNKCKKANLEIDRYILFSKSGFSKELELKKARNVTLYDLEDFEKLLI
ncbi:MAG: DUF234 domain-containing protein [Sulfurospirillum sp.]